MMGFLRYGTSSLDDLIIEAQNSSGRAEDALIEVVRRFEPLVRKLGRVWAADKAHREDVENAARFALIEAVARHRGSADTFPGYARVYMTGAARREATRWSPPPPIGHWWS